ncbi:MAG: hypothetical protein ACYDHH_33890 [Solirubrobacteraceae bacterium]
MGPRRMWIAAMVAGLLGAALTLAAAGPAGGWRLAPIAHIACKATPGAICSESGPITVSGNANAVQSTDTVPPQATSATTDIVTPSNFLPQFDSVWEAVVQTFPKLGVIKNTTVRRVLTCAVMAHSVSASIEAKYLEERAPGGAVLGARLGDTYLNACLLMVAQAQSSAPAGVARARATAAAATCPVVSISVPVLISRVGSAYKVQPTGATSIATGAHGLKVTCRGTATGAAVTVRTRFTRARLRQVVGPKFSIGFANPTKTSVPLRNTYTFR